MLIFNLNFAPFKFLKQWLIYIYNDLSNRRRVFIFNNLRTLFMVSANALTLKRLNFDNG